jgi:hypothetical protein
MTDQEIHAVIGKAREDYRNAKREYAALEATAAELANHAAHLHQALSNPSRMIFWEGTPIMGDWIKVTPMLFDNLSAANVKKLIENIQRVKKTRDALRQRLIELEGEDPEGGRR